MLNPWELKKLIMDCVWIEKGRRIILESLITAKVTSKENQKEYPENYQENKNYRYH